MAYPAEPRPSSSSLSQRPQWPTDFPLSTLTMANEKPVPSAYRRCWRIVHARASSSAALCGRDPVSGTYGSVDSSMAIATSRSSTARSETPPNVGARLGHGGNGLPVMTEASSRQSESLGQSTGVEMRMFRRTSGTNKSPQPQGAQSAHFAEDSACAPPLEVWLPTFRAVTDAFPKPLAGSLSCSPRGYRRVRWLSLEPSVLMTLAPAMLTRSAVPLSAHRNLTHSQGRRARSHTPRPTHTTSGRTPITPNRDDLPPTENH
jgi:hypothetical protein